MIELLPQSILVDSFAGQSGIWINHTLQLLAEEARDPKPGGETVLTRLTDILVVQAIRFWLSQTDHHEGGWIAALRDPRIGRAMQAFHQSPDEAWTLASLASTAGMSRSAFAARFKTLTGEGPMQYAIRWRMQLACTALKDGGRTLSEISADLGYESEAAFARAFKREIGTTPGIYRKS